MAENFAHIETPNFDEIAERLTQPGTVHSDEDSVLALRASIAEELVKMWNARGRADIWRIENIFVE